MHGYMRLDPIPSNGQLAEFYEADYYRLIRQGGRAHTIGAVLGGGSEAQDECEWLRESLHGDIIAAVKEFAAGPRVLDVGCGTGGFLASAKAAGLVALGVEPSVEAADIARSCGLEVQTAQFDEYVARLEANGGERFDALTMLNVLEHVPAPTAVVASAARCLAPGGLLAIVVPNDFSEMQKAAVDALSLDRYWVAMPDHINYFSLGSLTRLLSACGFEVVRSQSDFPMEWFLLMGEDYVSDSAVGASCHARRKRFERSLPAETRRELYRALASAGAGRCCMVFARLLG